MIVVHIVRIFVTDSCKIIDSVSIKSVSDLKFQEYIFKAAYGFIFMKFVICRLYSSLLISYFFVTRNKQQIVLFHLDVLNSIPRKPLLFFMFGSLQQVDKSSVSSEQVKCISIFKVKTKVKIVLLYIEFYLIEL